MTLALRRATSLARQILAAPCPTQAAAEEEYDDPWRNFLRDIPEEVKNAHPDIRVNMLPDIGVECFGVDLRKPLDRDTAAFLEANMAVHGLVCFRGQGVLSGEEQIDATCNFGTRRVFSMHAIHKEAVHTEVMRMSNHEEVGFTNNGGGWHHDGNNEAQPYGHVSYHIVSVPKKGQTRFAHTGAAADALMRNPQIARIASQLLMVNSHSGTVKPLLYKHPVTQRISLMALTGQVGAVLRMKKGEPPKALRPAAVAAILPYIHAAFDDSPETAHVRREHQWEEGDIVITDNLTVAHSAGAGAHDPSPDNGLRILHRVTIQGSYKFDTGPWPWLQIPEELDGSRPDRGDCPFPMLDEEGESELGIQGSMLKDALFDLPRNQRRTEDGGGWANAQVLKSQALESVTMSADEPLWVAGYGGFRWRKKGGFSNTVNLRGLQGSGREDSHQDLGSRKAAPA